MDDRVFELFSKAINSLDDDQKKIFHMGFDLGISEGIARCTEKLSNMNKEKKCKNVNLLNIS